MSSYQQIQYSYLKNEDYNEAYANILDIKVLNSLKTMKFYPKDSILSREIYSCFSEKNFAKQQYTLIIIFLLYSIPYLILYIINKDALAKLDQGSFLPEMDKKVLYSMCTWPFFTIWSFTSYFIQKQIQKHGHLWKFEILHYFSILVVFMFGIIIVLYFDMNSTVSIFLGVQCCIHSMKMYSYHRINILLRKQMLLYNLKNKELKNAHSNKDNNNYSLNNINDESYNDIEICDDDVSIYYPNNLNLNNYVYFLLAPTLSYWPEYPKKEYISIKAIFLWFITGLFFFCLTNHCANIVIGRLLFPIMLELNTSVFINILILSIPSILCYIFVFIAVWECILNIYGELTKFADREFYQDWWNCINFNEFGFKWNNIAHRFLYRHVYLECRIRYNLSKEWSALMTIVVSALLHDYIAGLLTKRCVMFFSSIMLLQIPFIKFTYAIKSYLPRRIINIIFWAGLTLGVSGIYVAYFALFYNKQQWLNLF